MKFFLLAALSAALCLLSAHASHAATISSTGGGNFTNLSVSSQSGTFSADFDSVPSGATIDAVTGLSVKAAASLTDLAVIVRFNNTGHIDARNGSAYAAAASITYAAGKSYHFHFDINTSTHTYDAYVTPSGGTKITIGKAYAFRTEQASAASLANLAVWSSSGTHSVSNFAWSSAASPSPSPTPVVDPTPVPTTSGSGCANTSGYCLNALPVNVYVPSQYSSISTAISAMISKYGSSGTLSQGVAIHVATGSYGSFSVPNTVNGTSSAPFRIISDTKWGAKINGQIRVGGGKPRKADYVEIVGFDVSGNVDDGIITYGAYNKILYNHVHDLLIPNGCMTGVGGSGIATHYTVDSNGNYATYSGHDNLVKGNVIERIGPPFSRPFTSTDIQQQYCHFVHGIYPSNYGNTITDNVINGTPGWGIHLYHYVYRNTTSNNTLLNNLSGGVVQGADSASVSQSTLNSSANRSLIFNNVVAFNKGQPGIEDRWGIYSIYDLAYNNVYYQNAGGDYFYSTNGDIKDYLCSLSSGLGTASQRCRYVLNPTFVNYSSAANSGNYHLSTSSPLYGKGLGATDF